MPIRYPTFGRRRRAFTLIEMLVVIAIMLALMGMVLLFYPKRDARLAAQGAEQLQTYIASAKSRALRDRAPRGVRLIQDPNGGFRELQFIEVPEPYVPAATAIANNAQPSNTPANTALNHWVYIAYDITSSVLPGDFIEIVGDSIPHRITAVQFNPPGAPAAGVWGVQLMTQPTPSGSTQTWTGNNSNAGFYRFIRQPRTLLGEPTLQLPKGVFIQPDNGSNIWPSSVNVPQAYNQPNAANLIYDIIFSASGAVINSNGGRIVLVVCDDTPNPSGTGRSPPTLITVYARTGGVAAHPKGPAGSEYIYTQDGRSSGQ